EIGESTCVNIETKDVGFLIQTIRAVIGDGPADHGLGLVSTSLRGQPRLQFREINTRLHEREIAVTCVYDDPLWIFSVQRLSCAIGGHRINRDLKPSPDKLL